MNSVKVSIIIPTYNQGQFINDTLTSIQDQTYKDFEVIIHDSNSSDNTTAICENFCKNDSRFRYFKEKDSGQSDAINRGLKKSNGTYFTWICSDDTYASPEALARLVSKLDQSNHECVGAFGLANYISQDGQYVKPYYTIRSDVNLRTFQTRYPFSQPTSMLKTFRVKEVGGVRNDLHLSMDLDLFIRLLKPKGSTLKFVDELIANVRLHPESKTVGGWKLAARECLKVHIKHFGIKSFDPTSVYLGLVVSSFLGTPTHKLLKKVYHFIRE